MKPHSMTIEMKAFEHFFAVVLFVFYIRQILTISLPKSIMETCSVVLTFESVDEILWCDHSN